MKLLLIKLTYAFLSFAVIIFLASCSILDYEEGKNSSKFASYIVGINSMRKAGPVIIETKAVLGRGPTKKIVHHNYV